MPMHDNRAPGILVLLSAQTDHQSLAGEKRRGDVETRDETYLECVVSAFFVVSAGMATGAVGLDGFVEKLPECVGQYLHTKPTHVADLAGAALEFGGESLHG